MRLGDFDKAGRYLLSFFARHPALQPADVTPGLVDPTAIVGMLNQVPAQTIRELEQEKRSSGRLQMARMIRERCPWAFQGRPAD